jgi:hypothetical protein
LITPEEDDAARIVEVGVSAANNRGRCSLDLSFDDDDGSKNNTNIDMSHSRRLHYRNHGVHGVTYPE